ncbi:MAG: ClbS/DfsB family four-helix bundle protein [Saprospiraceae bacterium]|nr:ClbS/DfsB family four-helix bundle protein [Saprospiraceae bacterium]
MPRPKTKEALISLSVAKFEKLISFIDALTPEEQNTAFPADMLSRGISDVLAHLHHWHLFILEWYEIGMSGAKPNMPAEGYTWKDLPALNNVIWEKYKNTSLKDAKKMLDISFEKVQLLIGQHSDEELFEKKRYSWTGSTSLAAYLISATSSHYDWGLKLIKRALKTANKAS